jgi:hypothetical protein
LQAGCHGQFFQCRVSLITADQHQAERMMQYRFAGIHRDPVTQQSFRIRSPAAPDKQFRKIHARGGRARLERERQLEFSLCLILITGIHVQVAKIHMCLRPFGNRDLRGDAFFVREAEYGQFPGRQRRLQR